MVYHHAVPHLNGTQKFWYDANGNMITRNVGTSYSYGYRCREPPDLGEWVNDRQLCL